MRYWVNRHGRWNRNDAVEYFVEGHSLNVAPGHRSFGGASGGHSAYIPPAMMVLYDRARLAIDGKHLDASIPLVFRVLVGKRFNIAEIHLEPL